MDVAEQYPARTDTNGITWYRPGFPGKTPPAMWGWTSDPQQAHESYADAATLCPIPDNATAQDRAAVLEFAAELQTRAVPPQPTTPPREESPMTELTFAGAPDTGRYSDFMHYPLPPLAPREEVQFDGYGRYKIPSPTTGKLTSYTRATTVASTTADEYNLVQWQIRTKVQAVLAAEAAYGKVQAGVDPASDRDMEMGQRYVELLDAIEGGNGRSINKAIDRIDDVAGGADARELGGAVHDWLGALDMGQVLAHQIPEMFQPYVAAYQQACLRAGIVAVPDYVERLVLNDRGKETVVGRIDRIYRVITPGTLKLGDLKTSKSLEFSQLEYAVQFAVYGWATLMLDLDGITWNPMPEIDDDMCLCVHVPSDQPERSQVVPYNLWHGGEYMVTALQVREDRKEAKKTVNGQTTPIPTREALRFVQARQALQDLDPEDALAIKETYQDVWNDELEEFAAQCFELAITTNTEE